MDVVISLQDGYSLDEISAPLEAAGLERVELLPELGVLTGWVDERRLPGLSGVKGVSRVEAARDYRLPSPDEPVQ